MTAFVGPATGETVWYLTDTVSKPLFAAFARAVGAGPKKRVVLLLDNAGWHTLPNLPVPDYPGTPFLRFSVHGADEAFEYVCDFGSAWQETAGAIEWLVTASKAASSKRWVTKICPESLM